METQLRSTQAASDQTKYGLRLFTISTLSIAGGVFVFGALAALTAPARGNTEIYRSLASETRSSRSLAQDENGERLQQARELLGRRYRTSVLKPGNRGSSRRELSEVTRFIHEWVRKSLKGQWQRQYRQVSDTILEESRKYSFDPVFLLAMIGNESEFNPRAIGSVGEIGLMQLRPETARWVCDKVGMRYHGDKSLFNPVTNIRIGSAYLAYLREQFGSSGRLYVAAYNAGQRNIQKAMENNFFPKEYATRVMQKYVFYYSMLSTRVTRALAKVPE